MATLENFMTAVEKDDFGRARTLCPSAMQEYLLLTKGMNEVEKGRVAIVGTVIDNTERGQFRSVYAQLRSALEAFRLHLKPLMPREVSPARLGRPLAAKTRRTLADTYEQSGQQSDEKNSLNRKPSERMVSKVNPDLDHFNNYIFDNNDIHRPTKTSEKFLELYEHEWRDAFTEIGEQVRSDRRIIQILLEIVQAAYRQNRSEAERQIDKMEAAVFDVVVGKSTRLLDRRPQPDRHLLIQHRKNIASFALDRLRQEFIDDTIRRIFDYHRISCGPLSRKFSGMCAEITWWMVVQDPPIHMVTAEHGNYVDGRLYTTYNFPGRNVDYPVWPALLLHRDGPVLSKGIVQPTAT